MKKLLCILLSFAVVLASCAVAVSASNTTLDKSDIDTEYPLIVVAGYSATSMYLGDSPETGEHVWGINTDDILNRVLDNIVELGVGLGAMTVGNAEIIGATVGREINEIFEKMRCNPDGSSVYDLKRYVVTAEETNSANLMELYPDGSFRHEQNIADECAEYIGNENIYNFTCDFRMGAEYCANQLNDLVESVKEHSGKDKVNLLAVSHGGQVSATYLTLFGHKNSVDNAVLTVPAIGGAGIAYDALTAQLRLDEECLIRFIEHGTRTEEDYDWLVKAQYLGFVDDIFNAMIPHIFDTIGYWGSLWDFIPPEKYEETKALLLDSEESAALIETSDRFHYEIYPKIGEKLQECVDNGMNISIISGTGNRIVTGLNENSDAIITTAASTGATVAPYGRRFADGYVQKLECGGKNKISPDMAIDASTSYLPDNTWFVNGLFHGMTYWDYYTRELMMTLLFTDKITDVYSDPEFPQFKDTTNPSSAVHMEFKGFESGRIGQPDTLVITNCCWENELRLASVTCQGANLRFKINPFRVIKPGESVEIEVTGSVPEISGAIASVTACYTMNTVTPLGYRTQYFAIDNGESVEYEGGYSDLKAPIPFDFLNNDAFDSLLTTLGLRELFVMVFNLVSYWLSMLLPV